MIKIEEMIKLKNIDCSQCKKSQIIPIPTICRDCFDKSIPPEIELAIKNRRKNLFSFFRTYPLYFIIIFLCTTPIVYLKNNYHIIWCQFCFLMGIMSTEIIRFINIRLYRS